MSNSENRLPGEVQAAIDAGRLIDAIKLLRDASGLGLKEAKDVVEAHKRGDFVPVPSGRALSGEMPGSVIQALQAGNKIEAIRLLREQRGIGLREAKEAVEAMSAPGLDASAPAPGEVPRGSTSGGWLVAAMALAALAAYYLFSGASP